MYIDTFSLYRLRYLCIYVGIFSHLGDTHTHTHTGELSTRPLIAYTKTFHWIISRNDYICTFHSGFSLGFSFSISLHTRTKLCPILRYMVFRSISYFSGLPVGQYLNVIYFRAAFVARSLFERTERFEYLSDTKANCERRTANVAARYAAKNERGEFA